MNDLEHDELSLLKARDTQARVLLIDDQLIVAEAFRRMFAAVDGIDIHYCRDPAQAIEQARSYQPTVILQDLVMPGIDGLQLLDLFRADSVTSSVPIIVLSTKEDPKIKSEAFALGASDYLVKFPDKIEVLARIRAHSRSYLAQQQRDEAHRTLAKLKVELERKNGELEALSCRDGLTGILNRRGFDEYLSKEWLRAIREGRELGLLLVDIDCFKTYNDNYGHQGGDECLRRVAYTLGSGLKRPSDVVGRYGGEEFGVILPDTALDGG
ncbi:MAG: two-component system chemotaxis family response regulator WspR, partial [Halothiobacillaceae bacterium]